MAQNPLTSEQSNEANSVQTFEYAHGSELSNACHGKSFFSAIRNRAVQRYSKFVQNMSNPMAKRAMHALYAQYFVVGIVSSALPATLYGFFLNYLAVDAYVYATAAQVIALPWSFKICFGMLNDCFPLRGYRRKPYMTIGWLICTMSLLAIAVHGMPQAGQRSASGWFSSMMALAAAGYIMADVAADGLVVGLAKQEDIAVRGTLQSNVYLVRTLGSVVAALLVGLGMNGHEYNGEFSWSLSFTQVCVALAIPSAVMVIISWYGIHDERSNQTMSAQAYLQECYKLLSQKGMFYLSLYSLAHGSIGGINTTAGGNVAKVWANVKVMQSSLFGIVGAIIFAGGLHLVKTRLLHVNWRHTIVATTVCLTILDGVFTFCTIYNVIRNQYFYLGETIVVMVPAAARFMVTTLVVVEIAPDGQEGVTYGLLTTLHNLGGPVAQAISNSLFARFTPSLSNAANYVRDSLAVRNAVAQSYALSYGMGLVALLLLPLLPSQKKEARERMLEWPAHTKYAKGTIALTVSAWIYSVTMNMLAMFPQTQCLTFVGGEGC